MSFLIKVGGSLTPKYVRPLYSALKHALRGRRERVVFFPGGGDFADLVRRFQAELGLSDKTAHAMALASLDQNAHMVADICQCECVSSVKDLAKVRHYPAVIAPYRLLTDHAPFSRRDLNIDRLSSTSSALYCAYLLKARLIIATDVDGIFDRDPVKSRRKAVLFSEIRPDELKKVKRGGPLDETIPFLIEHYGMEAWVLNGKFPERLVEAVVTGKLTMGTVIRPSRSS